MATKSPLLPALPPEIASSRGPHVHIVATVDPDGRASTTLMSWVVIVDGRTLRLCVDTRSRTFQNLVERPAVGIEILADGVTWGVKGEARVLRQQMASTPFPCALVEVAIDEARDHGVTGTVFRGPTIAYEADKQHRLDFERRVFDELASG
jgi:hypothetical protein